MSFMNAVLSPELEKWIQAKVESGQFASPTEVVETALELLQRWDEQKLEALRRELQVAEKEVELGLYQDYDEHTLQVFFDQLTAEGIRKLASERAQSR